MAQATTRIPGDETTLVTRSEMTDEGLKTLTDRITGIVAEFGGEVVASEDWGKRKLAYLIDNETRAQYTYIAYTGKGDVVHEIERNLRIHDHVLRFLTVNLEKEFDAETYRKARAAQLAAIKKREEEREARREERAAERRGYSEYRQSASQMAAAAEDVRGAE